MKNEISLIRSRVVEDLYSSKAEVFKDDVQKSFGIAEYEALSAAYPDGTYYFTDLNYSPENRTAWGGTISANRLINLLKWGRQRGGEEEERARALVLGHLQGFFSQKYTNLNWWHLCIGIPQTVSRLLLMLEGTLQEDLFAYLLSLAERGSIVKDGRILKEHKGANLIWFCDISILHALLTEDEEELSLAKDIIAKETFGRPDAGLQSDGSFFQHGRLLYSLGYGRSYLVTLAPLFYYLGGTSFAFPDSALHNLFSHVLDGVRHMTNGRGFDYLTMGREYVRQSATNTAGVRRAMGYLAALRNVPRAEELRAFYRALCDGTTPKEGNKYFPVSRFLTHQSEGLYVSFRALDETLYGTENCNEENVLGIHLAFGVATCVMRTGEEYRSIAPLLRYDCMPGTTCSWESDEEMIARLAEVEVNADPLRRRPDVICVTGGNFGDLSVSFMHARHDGITHAAACIATPHGALFLGVGQNGGKKPLHTTLEQCNATGEISVREGGRAVCHNGVCYVSHADAPLCASVEHRVGSWKRNSRLSPDTPHEGDVFLLYTEHKGREFHYAYEILPEEKLPLASEVLENSHEWQRARLPDGREVSIHVPDGKITVQ